MTSPVPEPGALTVDPGGALHGRTGGYDKRLGELAGVYRDADAYAAALAEHGADHLVYRVEEHRSGDGPGALPLRPGRAADGDARRAQPGRPARSRRRRARAHRSVNVGTEPFVTLFCYPADAGQDYALIADARGMAQLVVDDGAGGWTTRPNPDHTGYRSA